MAEDQEAEQYAEEAQDTAEDASGVADENALPSGLTGAPPPEALPVIPGAPAPAVGSVVTPPATAPANPEAARQGEFAAGQEGVQAAEGQASAVQEGNDVEQARLAAIADQQRDENIDRQADQQAEVDARDKFAKQVSDANDAVKNFKFQDHFANESTARKAANAISVFLGGLGNLGGQAPGSANYALQALETHEKEDYDQQLQYLNSAKYFADKKREGYTDLLSQQREDRRTAELNYAAKRSAIADEFASQASSARGKANYAAAQMEIAKRKEDVAKRQTDVFKDISSEEYQKARGQAALLKANKHRGTGGGSSTGDKGYAALLDELQSHPEYGPGDQAKAALKFGVPTNAKAGRNSLKTALDVVAKGQGAGVRDERQVDKEVQEFSKSNGVPDIIKKQRELTTLQKELSDNPHNPLLQALAVEKAVSAARGGAASKQALSLALGHLGGTLDNAESVISKIRSGEIGPKQLENFNGFINGQLGAAQAEGKTAYDNFDKYIEAQPPAKKTALEAARGRVFSGLHGFQGAAPAGPSAAALKTNSALERLGGVRIE